MIHRLQKWLWNRITNWLTAVPENRQDQLRPLNSHERMQADLKPGDVLLFAARTRVGEIIKMITVSRWIHSALYVGRLSEISDPKTRETIRQQYNGDEDDQLVIESILGQGTVVNPVSKYRSETLRVCRPSELFEGDADRLVNEAASHLGLPYDVRQILDLARFMFPYGMIPGRWRSTLFRHNAGEPTEVVCSGMIARCFQSIDFPILPIVLSEEDDQPKAYKRNFRLFVPADFDHSPYFDIVKFPKIDLCRLDCKSYVSWNSEEELESLPLEIAVRPITAQYDDGLKHVPKKESRTTYIAED